MENPDTRQFLFFALDHFGLRVVSSEGKMVYLEKSYSIEIEGETLFKLSHEAQVIAPFSDVEELCRFIQMDMQLNG